MSVTPKPDALRNPYPGKCLARSVAEALAENPTLEAVTVDQAHHTISVATLGRADVRPDAEAGRQACLAAQTGPVAEGTVGAEGVLRIPADKPVWVTELTRP